MTVTSGFVSHPFPIPDDSPFPVSNIPFGIFSTAEDPTPRPGAAIGDYVIDLFRVANRGALTIEHASGPENIFREPTLNRFAALPRPVRSKIRKDIQELIKTADSPLYNQGEQPKLLIARAAVSMHLPFSMGGFTDYTCSLEHVTNVGRVAGFGDIPPSFRNQPLAYNGRASSVVASGTPIQRPYGVGSDGLYPCQKLDYEVELGMFVSTKIPIGELIPASRARDYIFGFVLLNDWSARDVQFAEMIPLGPFNGKSCGTSISTWVVTMDALEEAGAIVPAKADVATAGKFTSNPFLKCAEDVSIDVSTFISRGDSHRTPISRSNLKHTYWSAFQMLAHHTSAGCGLAPGDLIGTGTLSSSAKQAGEDLEQASTGLGRLGCIHELTAGGKNPVQLASNLSLAWLQDNDEITLEGWAGEGDSRIGFGQVVGRIAPVAEVPGMVTVAST
ncbi:hypothetical protein BDV38DRAFT_294102 [Aspergillus pseudotamarii]|uniref:Fumarylacetoacetase n=1 Tax=Aspergillus pseudotamarii TaxID=132259 RepID=A0A5N6SMZ7_ASPPS|nr:uncharacterized protein BDV38DRAFT_294102 [Aspergillus pseudotamarii]KAE8136066.1 hypothetical protein BDV38DRAFT_294102 [Aspergillus pseudotamarii]